MKYIFLVIISAVAIPCLSFADEIETEKVIEILRSETIKSLTIEATQIEDPSLEACFTARLFATKVGVVVSGGRMSSGGYYALKDDRLIMVAMPNTNGPVPEFMEILNPKFTLKTEEDALILLSAIKVAYKVDSKRFDPRVVNDGNTWSFILGTFFKTLKGLVVTADASGAIKDVTYSVKIADNKSGT